MPDTQTTSVERSAVLDWAEHYRDEQDAAFLYRALAAFEPDAARRTVFTRLAAVEDEHVARWVEIFREHGQPVPAHRPSWKVRALAALARRFGTAAVLPFVLAEEGREVQAYLRLARGTGHRATHAAAVGIAADSAEHARELARLMGAAEEPWHVGGAGGLLRSVVYGFNDGLTANFGLVAGVIGADVAPHIVIITGIAGAIADALSMGSSGYLAAKSEAEVHAHQIELERRELKLMPDLEEAELALMYEAKGLPAGRAREMARAVMADPAQALATKVREELNIQPAELAPLKDGLVTGAATAVGAFIPIAPFLVLEAGAAVWTSLAVSMAAHFAIGAARSVFTGRSLWASGRDMFLVGFGVAVVGYGIGELIVRFF
jgi:VIT1/CCC1 family predicted Fe2+/Mn2+ transporter